MAENTVSQVSTSPEETQEKKIETRLIEVRRISHMKAGGRRFRFRAMVVAGDRQGRVGVAIGKGSDVAEAIQKAVRLATRDMIEIPLSGHTIPHEVTAKYCSAKVLLKPQRKGKGLVAGSTVRVVCELAGIQDISAKVLSVSNNKLNIARATILALQQLKRKKPGENGATPSDTTNPQE